MLKFSLKSLPQGKNIGDSLFWNGAEWTIQPAISYGHSSIHLVEDGKENAPVYSFSSSPESGIYRDEVGIHIKEKDNLVTIDKNQLNVKQLNISEGILYRSKNNNDLIWKCGNSEQNLSKIKLAVIDFPLKPQNGSNINPPYSFMSDTTTGFYLHDKNRVHYTTNNKPTVGFDQYGIIVGSNLNDMPTIRLCNNISNSATSGFYYSDGICISHENKRVAKFAGDKITFDKNLMAPNYIFSVEELSGLQYINNKICITNKSKLIMELTNKCVIIKQACMFNDVSELEEIKDTAHGLLYKRYGDNGIYWKTKDSEIDLTNPNKYIKFPIYAQASEEGINGYIIPEYSFKGLQNAPNSGMTFNGKLALVFGGKYSLIIDNENIIVEDKKLLLSNGSVSSPALSFISAKKTGLSMTNGKIIVSVNGKNSVSIGENEISTQQLVLMDKSKTNILKLFINNGQLYVNNGKETYSICLYPADLIENKTDIKECKALGTILRGENVYYIDNNKEYVQSNIKRIFTILANIKYCDITDKYICVQQGNILSLYSINDVLDLILVSKAEINNFIHYRIIEYENNIYIAGFSDNFLNLYDWNFSKILEMEYKIDPSNIVDSISQYNKYIIFTDTSRIEFNITELSIESILISVHDNIHIGMYKMNGNIANDKHLLDENFNIIDSNTQFKKYMIYKNSKFTFYYILNKLCAEINKMSENSPAGIALNTCLHSQVVEIS